MAQGDDDAPSNAILMVMLDPPEANEAELHDWYDTEHVPERAAIDGFHTLQRYVCLEGWPRYMALYDLASLDVLRSDAYQAVAGPNFSKWSKRVIGQVRGWARTEAVQVSPSRTRTGAKGRAVRVMVLRFGGVADGHEQALHEALAFFLSTSTNVLQSRLFRSESDTPGTFYAVVELSAPRGLGNFPWQGLKLPSGALEIANLYSRYWRREG